MSFNTRRELNASFALILLMIPILCVCFTCTMDAQLSVSIRTIDVSRFPIIDMKARILENNNRVPFIQSQNIQLFENGMMQQATVSCPNQSVSIVLILDKSTSMAFYPNTTTPDPDSIRWKSAKGALYQFIDQMSSQDEAAFMSFNRTTDLNQDFTSNTTLLKDAVARVQLGPYTALWAAIDYGVRLLAPRNNKKAIVVLTDGEDNFSFPITLSRVIASAKQSQVKIFSVGLGEDVGRSALDSLATQTGGTFYFSATGSDLRDIYSSIIQQIPDDCILTYTTTNICQDSTRRDISAIISYNNSTARDDSFYVAPNHVQSVRLSFPPGLYVRENELIRIPIQSDQTIEKGSPIQLQTAIVFDTTLLTFSGVDSKGSAFENDSIIVQQIGNKILLQGNVSSVRDSISTLTYLLFTGKRTSAGGLANIRFENLSMNLKCKIEASGQSGSILVDGICQKIVANKNTLHQNSPNPFNPSTNIQFRSATKQEAQFVVMNILGNVVYEKKWIVPEGDHTFAFDGSKFPSGMYFYKLQLGNWWGVKKMLLVR